MSLNISTRYGGRANAPSLDYPTGSFKNKTAPAAVDGTPLEKDWANDLLGARDAILAAAGLTANGTADTAQASQLLAALQALGLRAATETQAGVLEIATAAEAQAFTANKAIDGAKLKNVLDSNVLGMGQSWQTVTGSRLLNTNYTNTLPRSIFIAASGVSVSGGDTTTELLIDGVSVSSNTRSSAGEPSTHYAIVPPGGVYRFVSPGNTLINFWMEFK